MFKSIPRCLQAVRPVVLCAFAASMLMLAVPSTFAQQSSLNQSATATTVALPTTTPTEYNGDVRDLPQTFEPTEYYRMLNEFDAPPNEKPQPRQRAELPQPNSNPLAPMPAASANFAGVGFSDSVNGGQAGGGWPPDTNGDVGPTYYVQSVNTAIGIFTKATGARAAAFTINQLWSVSGTSTPCLSNNDGDPVVLHDARSDRWILTDFAFAFTAGGAPKKPFYQCIAVSKTSDPVSGGWYFYAIQLDTGAAGGPPTNTLNDYPKFGLWNDGCLYMGANGFTSAGGAYGGAIFASFSTANLYAGTALTSSIGYLAYATGQEFSLFPADLLGSSAGSLPPSGTPEYFVSESQTVYAFNVRKFTPGTNCGAGGALGAATAVGQTSYPTNSSTSDFVPQQGTTNLLDSLEDRLMQRVQYRKIGTAESIWVVHTTGDGSTTPAQSQWAQLNVSGGTVSSTPVQQQIFAPDTTKSRWMAGVAVDSQGNMAMGYSRSSSSDFPSIYYAGRLATDALNDLPQSEVALATGAGSQTTCGSAGTCSRWGDYSSMTIDPSDDCTFWFTTEYYDTAAHASNGNWQTRIASFKFPGCGVSLLDQTISFTSTAPTTATVGGSTYTPTATATSGLTVALTIDATASAVCSISGGVVSFTGVGSCVVDANQAGNASYNAAPQVKQTFTVGKGSQTISFTSTAPTTATVGGATYTPTATATSGLAVALTIDATASSVCSISGGVVSFTATGSCVIDANQAGNANFNAAPQVKQTFTVGKGSQTVSFTSTAPTTATVGGATYTPTATATSGLAVTLTIDATASAVCSISGGVVSFTATGSCVIDANQAGNTNYNAAPQVQQTFTVGKGSQTVSFTSTAPTTATVGGATYAPTATATSGLTVALTIDATASAVCSISGGVVSFTATGSCVIDANQAGNANFNAAPQVKQTFTVGKGSQTVSFTSTAPGGATVGGSTYTPTATATSGLTVALTIDGTASSVCSISGGVVSFTGVGSCVIDANQAGNANYNAAPQVQQTFTVGKGSQTVSFTSTAPTTATVGGATYTPTATATSGLTVALTIDGTASSVCSISGGVVSFTGVGSCVIDANQAGNANYNAAPQVQQTFTVGKASQTVSITSTAPTTATVGGATYTPTATATSGLTVALTIDGTASSVCSISGGVVSFTGAGSCVIDANQAGNANYNAAPQVQQTFTVGKASQTVSITSTAPGSATVGGATYTPTATATSSLTVALTIDGTASAVCSISGGVVSFTGVGSCVIDANQAGNGNYNAAPQVQQTFTVGKASQTVSFTSTAPTTATVGGATYTPTATATSALAVALTIDGTSSAVCSISGGVVSFTGAGSCVIDANQAGNANFNAAPQVQQTFTVALAPATQLVFTIQPTDVSAGNILNTVAVTEEDALGHVVSDTATVDFAVAACGGSVNIGSAAMVNGVATLTTTQRFYVAATNAQVTATAGALSGSSSSFNVVSNTDVLFDSGFESCRL